MIYLTRSLIEVEVKQLHAAGVEAESSVLLIAMNCSVQCTWGRSPLVWASHHFRLTMAREQKKNRRIKKFFETFGIEVWKVLRPSLVKACASWSIQAWSLLLGRSCWCLSLCVHTLSLLEGLFKPPATFLGFSSTHWWSAIRRNMDTLPPLSLFCAQDTGGCEIHQPGSRFASRSVRQIICHGFCIPFFVVTYKLPG